MYWLSTQSIFIIVLSLSIMACGNDSNEPEPVLNVDPVAMVAENQIVAPLMLVTPSGINSSDIDGSIAHYQWTQTAGVSITLSDDTTDTATFTAPDNGTDESLAFTLTVTDNNGASHSADTTVLVKVSTKISRSAWDNSFSKLESQNFVIWWGEQQGDLSEAASVLLIKAEQTWQVAVQDFGMIPPPGAEQYLTNIYIIAGVTSCYLVGQVLAPMIKVTLILPILIIWLRKLNKHQMLSPMQYPPSFMKYFIYSNTRQPIHLIFSLIREITRGTSNQPPIGSVILCCPVCMMILTRLRLTC
ncbi:MAG: hypothetical protein JKY14_01970 [Paraglaciecola sp.]|nr:hypothetical protein [Paraglaciecola sp.]